MAIFEHLRRPSFYCFPCNERKEGGKRERATNGRTRTRATHDEDGEDGGDGDAETEFGFREVRGITVSQREDRTDAEVETKVKKGELWRVI